MAARLEVSTQFGENERQAVWAQAYIDNGCDEVKAGEVTGYYVGNGHRVLNVPAVQKHIAASLEAAAKRVQLSFAGVLDEIRRLAFFDVRHMLDTRVEIGGVENPGYGQPLPLHLWPDDIAKCVAAVEFAVLPDGRRVVRKVKFTNKNDALTILAKHFKILIDQRNITLDGELVLKYEDMSADQIKARVMDVRDSLLKRYGGQVIEAVALADKSSAPVVGDHGSLPEPDEGRPSV